MIECEVVLSAVGIKSNIEDIGLEEVGIIVEKDKIKVDEYYRTNVEGYYAIGDIVPGQALAHVASHEGITCVEKIAGKGCRTDQLQQCPGMYLHQPGSGIGRLYRESRPGKPDMRSKSASSHTRPPARQAHPAIKKVLSR